MMRYLASGGLSKVFETSKESESVIIYSTCDLKMYLCQLSGVSKHYPIIEHITTSSDGNIDVYRMERLYHNENSNLIRRLCSIVENTRKQHCPNISTKELNNAIFADIRRQKGDLAEIGDLLYLYNYFSLFFEEIHFDFKFGNIMYRKNGEIVFNDSFRVKESRGLDIWDVDDDELMKLYEE